MAVIEQLVISKVIEDGSIQEAAQAGIRSFHFAGHFEKVWSWIVKYNADHGAVPTERAFSAAWGDISLSDTTGETFSGLFDELVASYRKSTLTAALSDAVQSMDKDEIDKAIQAISSGLQKAAADTVVLRDVNMVETWEARYEAYEKLRKEPNALRGIPTGFHGLDDITHGLRPQQLIIFAGEPKRGKSLFEMIMAMAAWDAGRKTLLITFEMSNAEQSARHDALMASVSYDNILSGNLNAAEMKRIYDSMKERKNRHPFMMSEDSSSLSTISAIRAKCQEHNPDVLYIDGVYLMDDEEGGEDERKQLTNITRGLKRLAQDLNIPIVGTTQVLPGKVHNKTTRQVTADSLGYTSSWAQDADLLLAVELDPEVDNQSIVRVVLARASKAGATIKVKWNWDTMEFTEGEYCGDEPDDEEQTYD